LDEAKRSPARVPPPWECLPARSIRHLSASMTGAVYTTSSVDASGGGTTTATTTYTPPQTFLGASTPVAGLLFRSFRTKPDGFFTFDAKVVQESLKKK